MFRVFKLFSIEFSKDFKVLSCSNPEYSGGWFEEWRQSLEGLHNRPLNEKFMVRAFWKINFFTPLKSLKKGVGFGVGSGAGSISQRYGSGDPDPGIRIKLSRIPNSGLLCCRRRFIFDVLYHVRLPLVASKLLESYLNQCEDKSLKVTSSHSAGCSFIQCCWSGYWSGRIDLILQSRDPDQHPVIAETDPITNPTFHIRICLIFANWYF
jgi:hypothetical protein